MITTLRSSDADLELETWYVPHDSARGLVVMFYGYASCKSEILGEAKAFHGLGFATLLVDFRGCGGSSGRKTSIGVFEADDVASAMAFVGREVSVPSLMLHGESDPRVRLAEAESIYQNLCGKKRFVVFPGLGHESLLASEAERWKQSVGDFLRDEIEP